MRKSGLLLLLAIAGCNSDAAILGDPDLAGSNFRFDLSHANNDLAVAANDLSGSVTDLAMTGAADLAMTRSTDMTSTHAIKTVFIILMENNNWSNIKGSSSAPYINNSLLPNASHAEMYVNVPTIHPSEPNYLWLEAGTNFGILNDNDPSANHQSTTAHLTTQLDAAGISWKSYQEDIDGTTCPVTSVKQYAPKHNPMVFFDDVTNHPGDAAYCTKHVRPFSELATDLAGGTVAQYNFITPNLCDDMHGSTFPDFTCLIILTNLIQTGDAWLKANVPTIISSTAYQTGGALFITWDESEGGDFPIGMIALSPFAKGGGYSNSIAYSHSSTLKTFQEIFGVGPLLGGAADPATNNLADLFSTYP